MKGETPPGPPGESAQGLILILGSSLTVMALLAPTPVLPRILIAYRDIPNIGFGGRCS